MQQQEKSFRKVLLFFIDNIYFYFIIFIKEADKIHCIQANIVIKEIIQLVIAFLIMVTWMNQVLNIIFGKKKKKKKKKKNFPFILKFQSLELCCEKLDKI
jgi:hypothetical protein